jgi:Tol biopolymer transport system component
MPSIAATHRTGYNPRLFMNDLPPPGPPTSSGRPPDDRLDSWKEIAAYMKRDVTTVQRWEKREGMPVHRHVHDKMGSVYAFRTDLDAWARSRNLGLIAESAQEPEEVDTQPPAIRAAPKRRPAMWLLAATGAVLAAGLMVWQVRRPDSPRENPLADARFLQLTDFPGTEQAATLSRDGRFVAFLSDRDGRMDVWVTQVGTGQFYNLTRDAARELANPSVRTLGFSPDGTLVTFWARSPAGASQSSISVWGAPILGGQARPYLDGIAEYDWSSDGARLVYHTPGPGDPMFVRDSGQTREARAIYTAPPGLHSHFQIWSPDHAFIYFVQGSPPDRMDVWRISATGGAPERITSHDSIVTHPVFLNARTLLYLASDSDGFGPWIYSLDVERRISHRVSVGIDKYTSLAASGDGSRLVATLARPDSTLWRLPITGARAESSSARRIPLTTGSGSSPRLGADYLLYVSSKGASDSIWKLQGEVATAVWSAPETRIIGGPTIARDGRRIAFSIRQNGQTSLYAANVDGTDARIVTRALELHGSPAWAPDGQSITVAAVSGGVPRLFSVPLDGRSPARFVEEYSVDPVWSPDGDIVVFSGPDIGTTFPINAVKADSSAHALPKLTLTRGARHVSFMPGRRTLVVARGDLQHKNLWLIDLETGAEYQLTNLAADFEMRDFDISPDGRELVLEQVQEHSDVVLLELPQR